MNYNDYKYKSNFMQLVDTEIESVFENYPKAKEWFDIIKNKLLVNNTTKPESDEPIFQYLYGYFVPKMNSDEEREAYYNEKWEEYKDMIYDDRLKDELSKVRVELVIQIGNFSMVNPLEIDFMPPEVREVIDQNTRVKMVMEYLTHKNEDVLETVPGHDFLLEEVKKSEYYEIEGEQEEQVEEDFDIDEILDQISKQGMESLTSEQKRFLDSKSK